MYRTCRKALVGFSAVAAAALTPATASGIPPDGQCPNSYPTQITQADAEAAGVAALFAAVNKNGDGFICFKPYPKKTGGNVIDNTAAPHS